MNKIAFAFDATGSMSPCINELRRRLNETVSVLFKDVPDLEVNIVVFEDYCDGPRLYRETGFTNDLKTLGAFITQQKAGGGGDAKEAYELVLHNATKWDWTPEDKKILVVIGDQLPHDVGYPFERSWVKTIPASIIKNARLTYDTPVLALKWQDELQILAKQGVQVHGVQCLGNRSVSAFYEVLAVTTNGVKVDLHQLANVIELIEGVVHRQAGTLDQYEETLVKTKRMNRAVSQMMEQLRNGKKSAIISYKETDLDVVDPARFQIFDVIANCRIDEFVALTGATFKKGAGFYEFMKKETIQERKEVVLRDKETGDLFSGAKAREMIGLPFGSRGDIRPVNLPQYDVFIQSTANNRKLIGGTKFLYEVEHK